MSAVMPHPFFSLIAGLGGGELLLIFFVMLMLFGSERLPGIARGLGKAIRDFRKATSSVEEQIRRALDEPPSTTRNPVAPPKPPPSFPPYPPPPPPPA
jgi:sec-independent protein translocase protein TatA